MLLLLGFWANVSVIIIVQQFIRIVSVIVLSLLMNIHYFLLIMATVIIATAQF